MASFRKNGRAGTAGGVGVTGASGRSVLLGLEPCGDFDISTALEDQKLLRGQRRTCGARPPGRAGAIDSAPCRAIAWGLSLRPAACARTKVCIGGLETVAQGRLGAPAQPGKLGNVEELARRSVRARGVEGDRALIAH